MHAFHARGSPVPAPLVDGEHPFSCGFVHLVHLPVCMSQAPAWLGPVTGFPGVPGGASLPRLLPRLRDPGPFRL
jgi:hypothetical protein